MENNLNKKKNNKKIYISCFIIISSIIIIAVIIFGRYIYESIEKNRYPIKYAEEVDDAYNEFMVSKALIYSVIKAESNFDANAVSRAGAKGLMQLMPDTYSWLAKKLGDDGDTDLICDVKTNVRYGVYYLSTLIKKYENTDTALCAYNAGPGRVDSWLSDTRYSEDKKTLTVIPFEETKGYVKKVNGYIEKYKKIYEEFGS